MSLSRGRLNARYDQGSVEHDQRAVEQILQALSNLAHGSVQIIVEDAKIVQIDRLEKLRLNKSQTPRARAP